MIRQVCWTEKLDDGDKREIRVTVDSREVKWQFKLSSAEKWDYATPPSLVDWDNLLERMENRYQRRNVSFDDLKRVRQARANARGESGGMIKPKSLKPKPSLLRQIRRQQKNQTRADERI